MIYPDPKPAPNEPKARKPLTRSRPRKVRSRPRPGRLKGEELSDLRRECYDRDKGMCMGCKAVLSWEACHMAHIGARRRYGDSLSNVRLLCEECHRISHAYGPSGLKPCKKKEEAMATVHIVRIENQDDMAGVARPGEPYPRPFVTLKDGRTMTYKEWTDANQPA